MKDRTISINQLKPGMCRVLFGYIDEREGDWEEAGDLDNMQTGW